MATDGLQQIQEFTYAGEMSPETLLVSGGMILALVAGLTWWQCRDTRPWLTPLLTGLRVIAVAVILWMLAEPSVRTVTERHQPRAIAILADRSASMTVVDDQSEQTRAVRWAAVSEPLFAGEGLIALDRATQFVTGARDHIARLHTAMADRQGLPNLQRHADLAAGVLDAFGPAITIALTDKHGPDDLRGRLLPAVATAVTEEITPRVRAVAGELAAGTFVLDRGAADRLESLVQVLDTEANRLADAGEQWCAFLQRVSNATIRNSLRRSALQPRCNKVAALLAGAEADWLGALARQVGILRYAFDDEVTSTAARAWGRAEAIDPAKPSSITDLSAPLLRLEQDALSHRLAAAVLITDGAHHADTDPRARAAELADLPVFVVPIGNTEPLRDVVLHHVQAPRAAFVEDQIVIDAMLDAYGCQGEALAVTLSHDGRELATRTLTVTSDRFFLPLSFDYEAPAMGRATLTLSVGPLPQEKTEENNRANVTVEITDDDIHVLLIDETPRWEFRYLRNLFKRDERIICDGLLFRPPAMTFGDPAHEPFESTAPALPADLDAWGQYRVVILGDVTPEILTAEQQERVRDYVAGRGGTLILIAGDAAMPAQYTDGPLGPLVPVESVGAPPSDERGLRFVITPEGQSLAPIQVTGDMLTSRRVWNEQMKIYQLSSHCHPKPTSHVAIAALTPEQLANPDRAVPMAWMCWQQYGKGRVVYFSAPVSYRLRYRRGDEYHYRFWGELLRWAVARDIATGSSTVRLTTDKTQYHQGDAVQIRLRLTDPSRLPVVGAAPQVIAGNEGEALSTATLSEEPELPGVYRAVLTKLPVGTIRLRATGTAVDQLLNAEGHLDPVETVITVEPPPSLEMRQTRCNEPLLADMARATGGAVVPPTALPAALQSVDLQPDITRQSSLEPLWPRWLMIWIVVGCLSAEWLIRKLVNFA